jgi:hypothetical protein
MSRGTAKLECCWLLLAGIGGPAYRATARAAVAWALVPTVQWYEPSKNDLEIRPERRHERFHEHHMVLNGHDSRNIFGRDTNSSARSRVMDDAAQRYHTAANLETDGAGFQGENPMQLGGNSGSDFLVTCARKRKFGKFAAKRRDEIPGAQDARDAVTLDYWNAPYTVLFHKAYDLA